VKVLAGLSSFPPSSSVGLPTQGIQGFLYSPNLGLVESALRGREWESSIWSGTVSDDFRSFVQVVKVKLTPVVMVPPRKMCGWERERVGAGRAGRGGGCVGHRGYA
jgi:hypothetical protein